MADNNVPMPKVARTFTVARNPDPDSLLKYLVRVPVSGGDVLLKARDSWPRTARVYCHRIDEWPDGVPIVEEVPVRSAVRRGVAIDLVLDRARENRSQFVFTRIQGGQEGIFWQSPRTAKSSRPGLRIPARLASAQHDLCILIDTRERYPYRFASQKTTTERRALPSGDYGVCDDAGEVVAVVERKSLADLTGSLVDGSLGFAMAELATVDRAAVVVEDRWRPCSGSNTCNRGSSPICWPACRCATRRFRSRSARRAH